MRKQLLIVTAALGFAGAANATPNGNGANEREPVRGTIEEQEQTEEKACPPGEAPTYVPPPQQQYYAPPAQTYVAPPQTYQPAAAPVRRSEGYGQWALSFGGGVADFVRDRIRDNAGVAGSWNARLMVGAHSIIAFEASYVGTAASANDVGSRPTLTTTQVFGDARLNLTRRAFQPFLFAGAGWINLHRHGSNEESPVASQTFNKNENTLVAPMGGGFAGYFGRHTTLEARGGYHFVADKDFTNTGTRPDMWVAELRAGYVF